MKILLILSLPLLFCLCTEAEETEIEPKDVVELIPVDNEISGWNQSGPLQVAENETQLETYIDGEAQIYVDNGFVKFARQYYQGDISGSTKQLELRIFDMGDTVNAKAVYDDVGTGYETPWTEPGHAGTEARIDETLLFDYKIDFWSDKFYVWITLYEEKTPAGLNIAQLFALNISTAISDTTQNE